MEWQIGAIRVTYDPETGAVQVENKPLEELQVFELYALLRGLYNDAHRQARLKRETQTLRQLGLERLRPLRPEHG